MFKDYYRWLFSIKGIKKIAALLCVLLLVFVLGIFLLESGMTKLRIQSENEKELGRLEVVLEKEINKIADLARYLTVIQLKALPENFTPEEYTEYYNSIQQISFGLLASDSIRCISVRTQTDTITYDISNGEAHYSAEDIEALHTRGIEYNRNVALLLCEETPGLLFMEYTPSNLSAGAHEVLLTLDLRRLSEACIQEIDTSQKSYVLSENGMVLIAARGSEIGANIEQLFGAGLQEMQQKPHRTFGMNGGSWYVACTRTQGGLVLLHAAEKAGYSSIAVGSLARGLLFCLIYLALTAVLVIAVFRSILRPIKAILNTMDTNMLAGEGYGPDVMAYIHANISGLYSKNSALSQRVYDTLHELRRQQLIAGQMQINPHFLSNTLSAINWMAVEKYNSIDNPISNALTGLSEIFYSSLNTSALLVPIKTEIAATKKYIEILKIRYGDDFNVHWDIDLQLLDKLILKTVLQPLIENCASHAFSARTAERNVYVSIRGLPGEIEVSVRDNGRGMCKERLQALRQDIENFDAHAQRHIGLRNIHYRLRLLYGEGYGLHIESEENRFTECSFRYPDVPPSELNIDL